MKTSTRTTRSGRRLRPLSALGAGVATLALVAGAAGVAHAAPELSLSDDEVDVSADIPNGTIDVTGIDFGAYDEEDLYVGVCTVRDIGLYQIPACGWFEKGEDGEVTVDGSGNLSATLHLSSNPIENAHADIPFSSQPDDFDCLDEQANYDGCEVVVAEHNGFSTTIESTTEITFVP